MSSARSGSPHPIGRTREPLSRQALKVFDTSEIDMRYFGALLRQAARPSLGLIRTRFPDSYLR
jgi:hypothetical protein